MSQNPDPPPGAPDTTSSTPLGCGKPIQIDNADPSEQRSARDGQTERPDHPEPNVIPVVLGARSTGGLSGLDPGLAAVVKALARAAAARDKK